jgi:hypothetical protein
MKQSIWMRVLAWISCIPWVIIFNVLDIWMKLPKQTVSYFIWGLLAFQLIGLCFYILFGYFEIRKYRRERKIHEQQIIDQMKKSLDRTNNKLDDIISTLIKHGRQN